MKYEENYIFYLQLVLQKNLLQILKVAKLSVDQFAESLGVTDQTIRNLCSFETRLSSMQFISILTMLELERKYNSNNKDLDFFLNILLNPENYKKMSILSEQKELNPENKKSRKKAVITAGLISTITMLGGAGVLIPAFLIGSAIKKEESSEENEIGWLEKFYQTRFSLLQNSNYINFKNSFKNADSKTEKEALVDKYINDLLVELCE